MDKVKKSKLVLGTVQLGMKYGVNNIHGKPSEEEAFNILDTAFNAGITAFDTAYAYGDAEEVLGRWIKARSAEDKILVISKLKPHILNEYPDGAKGSDVVGQEIEKSLGRLQIKRLDGYLFHSPHYIYLKHLVAGMQKAKEEGLVSNVGVSIYDEAEALQAAELSVDYIQVPYNLFDQRLDETNFFEIAEKNNVTVFARSPFLQGLLLLDVDKIPPYLEHAKPFLLEFADFAKEWNISRTALSLMFSYLNPSFERIVFGVDTVEQLKEDLEIIANPSDECIKAVQELKSRFQNMSRSIVLPSLWHKVKNI